MPELDLTKWRIHRYMTAPDGQEYLVLRRIHDPNDVLDAFGFRLSEKQRLGMLKGLESGLITIESVQSIHGLMPHQEEQNAGEEEDIHG